MRILPPVFLLLLASCIEQPAASPPVVRAVPVSVAVAPGSLDGTYQGQRAPDVAGPECGLLSPIGFDVAGNTIRLRTHRQRRALGGTVDTTGRFTMSSTDGTRMVSGEVRASRLVAQETTPPHRRRHDVGEPVPGGVCTARITADRVATPTDSGDEAP